MKDGKTQIYKPYDVFASRCPSREAFEHIFSRWGILITVKLYKGSMRFGTLHRAIDGISEKMLSHTLKILETEGLVLRMEWDEKPPHVEYSLTDSGIKIAKDMNRVILSLYEALENKNQESNNNG